MGMTDEQRAERDARVAALIAAAQPEPKGAKPAIVKEDATFGNEELIRGIPAVGRVSGTIKGTRPGDPASMLEQANRDLQNANLALSKLKAARQNLRRPNQS